MQDNRGPAQLLPCQRLSRSSTKKKLSHPAAIVHGMIYHKTHTPGHGCLRVGLQERIEGPRLHSLPVRVHTVQPHPDLAAEGRDAVSPGKTRTGHLMMMKGGVRESGSIDCGVDRHNGERSPRRREQKMERKGSEADEAGEREHRRQHWLGRKRGRKKGRERLVVTGTSQETSSGLSERILCFSTWSRKGTQDTHTQHTHTHVTEATT